MSFWLILYSIGVFKTAGINTQNEIRTRKGRENQVIRRAIYENEILVPKGNACLLQYLMPFSASISNLI